MTTLRVLCLICCLYISQVSLAAQDYRADTVKNSIPKPSKSIYFSETDSFEIRIKNDLELAGSDYNKGNVLGAIQKMQGLLLEIENLPKPTLTSFFVFIRAGNFFSSLDNRFGLAYYKKASELIPVLHIRDATEVFSLYTTRAGVHAFLMEMDSAMYYYYKSIDVAKTDDFQTLVSAYNNLGVHFFEQKQPDSAALYFKKALDILGAKENEISLYCSIRDNIAQLNMLEGEFHEAYRTFQFNDSVYFNRGNHRKYLTNKLRLLDVMQKVRVAGIEQQFTEIGSYINEGKKELRPQDILQFYRFAADYYSLSGRYKESIPYRQLYMDMSDSLNQATSDNLRGLSQTLLAIQEVSFTNELKMQNLAAEQTKLQLKSTRRMLLLALASASIIIFLVILYFRKRKQELSARTRVAEAEVKNKEMEARMMEQELALKQQDLTNVVLHNTQVYDTNQKMIERLQSIASQKSDMDNHVRSLLIELQSQNQVSDRSIALQANIESVNAAFYDNLKSQYADLTKSELELCGFIRINLSNKDISVLKNVEASSVKMGKNRLRKKLGIDPETDLYQFLQNI